VRRIFAEAKELNLPEPKIEEIVLCLRFTVYLAQPHQKKILETEKAEVQATPTTQQVTTQVTAQVKR